LFPRENELCSREAGDQYDSGIVVRPVLKQLGPVGEGCGLPQSDSFEFSGELLPELPGHTALFLFEACHAELSLLHEQADSERHQRQTRQEDCREEEENLSPV
jgi:hypothetical protein